MERCYNYPYAQKKGSKCEPNNYHPISLTSCVCKILEKIS